MNTKDCQGFNNEGESFQICKSWKSYPNTPATYLIVLERKVGRLNGESDILYVGETRYMGGINSNCRLWDYHTEVTRQEKHLKSIFKRLEPQGYKSYLYIYWQRDNGVAKKLEGDLLKKYEEDHFELPPFNAQR